MESDKTYNQAYAAVQLLNLLADLTIYVEDADDDVTGYRKRIRPSIQKYINDIKCLKDSDEYIAKELAEDLKKILSRCRKLTASLECIDTSAISDDDSLSDLYTIVDCR